MVFPVRVGHPQHDIPDLGLQACFVCRQAGGAEPKFRECMVVKPQVFTSSVCQSIGRHRIVRAVTQPMPRWEVRRRWLDDGLFQTGTAIPKDAPSVIQAERLVTEDALRTRHMTSFRRLALCGLDFELRPNVQSADSPPPRAQLDRLNER